MTYREACEFFHNYGNVGKCVSDLMNSKPTDEQLEMACQKCSHNAIDDTIILEAKLAILKGVE